MPYRSRPWIAPAAPRGLTRWHDRPDYVAKADAASLGALGHRDPEFMIAWPAEVAAIIQGLVSPEFVRAPRVGVLAIPPKVRPEVVE